MLQKLFTPFLKQIKQNLHYLGGLNLAIAVKNGNLERADPDRSSPMLTRIFLYTTTKWLPYDRRFELLTSTGGVWCSLFSRLIFGWVQICERRNLANSTTVVGEKSPFWRKRRIGISLNWIFYFQRNILEMKIEEWISPIIEGNLFDINRQSDKQLAANPQAKLSIFLHKFWNKT